MQNVADEVDLSIAADERYRTVLATIDEGFCLLEVLFDADERPRDFRFLETNAAFERHTGLIGAAGRTIRELLPDVEPAWLETYGRVALTGIPERFVAHAAGLHRWFDVNAFRIGDPAERKVGLLFTDVTARRAAERELHDKEERLRLATSACGLITWEIDLASRAITFSENQSEIIGFPLPTDTEEVLALVHPEDLPVLREALEKAIAENAGFRSEHRLVSPVTEDVVWLSVEGRVLDCGRRFLGVARNVTTEHRQEEALRQTADRMQILLSELQHRTRNLLGVVRVMADKTIAETGDLAVFKERFRARLDALARVNALLSRLGEGERVAFDDLVRVELAGHGVVVKEGGCAQVVLEGPDGVRLRSSSVQIVALGLHELITNAVKYGALSRPEGRLRIAWEVERRDGAGPRLRFEWLETGVPVPPERCEAASGYGRELIERALPYQLKAETRYELRPEGVRCTIALPLPNGGPRS